MSVYSDKIIKVLRRIDNGEDDAFDASGRAADFLCGVSLRFSMVVDENNLTLKRLSFQTTGCGYVAASAQLLSEFVVGKCLRDLEGVESTDDFIAQSLGGISDERQHCVSLVFDAFRDALAEFRIQRVETWNGDAALVCSCFGVSETDILETIREKDLKTVEGVGDAVSAGTGCGSCQQVITEILENSRLHR